MQVLFAEAGKVKVMHGCSYHIDRFKLNMRRQHDTHQNEERRAERKIFIMMHICGCFGEMQGNSSFVANGEGNSD